MCVSLQAGRRPAGGGGSVWILPLRSDPGQAGQPCSAGTGSHCAGETDTHTQSLDTVLPVYLINRFGGERTGAVKLIYAAICLSQHSTVSF